MSDKFISLRVQYPLLDVAGRYLSDVKKKGSYYFALCPFHDEKTPSLQLNISDPSHEYYYCYGCGAHGDSLDLIKHFDESYYQELLNASSPSDSREPVLPRAILSESKDSSLEELPPFGEEVVEQLHQSLLSCSDPITTSVREYALSRFSLRSIKAFKLGCLTHNIANKFSSYFKIRFRAFHRLLFPITTIPSKSSEQGQLAGFAGRSITTELTGPKCLYPKGFPKNRCFFGHDNPYAFCPTNRLIPWEGARTVFIVEGPADVLACYESGFTAIATLGTEFNIPALYHYLKSFRIGEEPIFVFDGDEAGQKAMQKVHAYYKQQGKKARSITLCSDDDPYTYLNTNSYNNSNDRHLFFYKAYGFYNEVDYREIAERYPDITKLEKIKNKLIFDWVFTHGAHIPYDELMLALRKNVDD